MPSHVPSLTVLARKPGADHRVVQVLPLTHGRPQVHSETEVWELADRLGVIHQVVRWEGDLSFG